MASASGVVKASRERKINSWRKTAQSEEERKSVISWRGGMAYRIAGSSGVEIKASNNGENGGEIKIAQRSSGAASAARMA
jgi:hypothetical protein